MLSMKSLIVIFCEVCCAFIFVFCGAFFWGAYNKKSLDYAIDLDQNTSNINTPSSGNPGIRYNPVRQRAAVTDYSALVFQSASLSAPVLDEFPNGTSVIIKGWDASRKFIKINLPSGIDGFISTQALSYENNVDAKVLEHRTTESATVVRQRLSKYFRVDEMLFQSASLFFDTAHPRLDGSPAVEQFLKEIYKNRSESSFSFDNFDFVLLGMHKSGSGVVIYPSAQSLVSMIRRHGVGIRFPTAELSKKADLATENRSGGYSDIEIKLTKEVAASFFLNDTASRPFTIKALKLSCESLDCQVVVDHLPDAASDTIGMILFDGSNTRDASFKMTRADSVSEFSTYFINFDGDNHDDLAISTNKKFMGSPLGSVSSVAINERGLWRLNYVKDYTNRVEEGIRWSPEPGRYDEVISVRLYTNKSQGMAYTVDGSEPECLNVDVPVIREVEILVDKPTAIKAKSCAPSALGSNVVTANYEVFPRGPF